MEGTIVFSVMEGTSIQKERRIQNIRTKEKNQNGREEFRIEDTRQGFRKEFRIEGRDSERNWK